MLPAPVDPMPSPPVLLRAILEHIMPFFYPVKCLATPSLSLQHLAKEFLVATVANDRMLDNIGKRQVRTWTLHHL